MCTETKECDHELEYVDDSFDHEFGTEIIRYYECSKCNKTFKCNEVDDWRI